MRETDRLARYLAGEMTAAEAAALEREAAADTVLAARLRAARAAWSGASAPDSTRIDVDFAWRRFAARAADAERNAERQHPPRDVLPLHPPATTPLPQPARSSRTFTPWRAAAAVLLLLGGAIVWRALTLSHTVVTATGDVRAVTLADGSEVRLGPDSRLVIRRGYGDAHRTVELRGEAFFRSVHSDAPPLTVETATARVRDVGTAFVVRSFAADGSVDVIVTDGTVWLGRHDAATGEGVLLHAGQHARLRRTDARPQPLGVADTAAALAWTRGRLVFENAALSDVALQLQRWYGLRVSIADSAIVSRRLNAVFEREPVDEVLAVITRSLGIGYRRTGDDVVFTTAR